MASFEAESGVRIYSVKLLLLLIAIKEASTYTLFPLVRTPIGKIQGTYKESFINRKYAAYEGIPYAIPPTEEHRFEPPKPTSAWQGILYAIKPAKSCVQDTQNPLNHQIKGDEDCLYLNIYAPTNAHSLPVLFAIHGGGFQVGSGSNGAKFFMDKDIILVTINYRLGPFGFLSTEDDIIPGNMGLKDQSLALKWVAKNIKYFGGDPEKVTLIGISAGSASVHYHYLSPMSKGLFQNGISFSGSAFGKHTENSREKSKKLATLMNCPTESISEMVSCLKLVPAQLIAEAVNNFMPWLYNAFTPFGPVVEKFGSQPFINRTAIEIIKSGDVADVLWISSFVSEEGLFPAAKFINNDKLLNDLDKNWDRIAPHLLNFNYTIPLPKHAEVARKIRRHYLGSKSINRNTVKELVKLIGDRLYIFNIEKAVRLQAQMNKSPILLMRYEYRAHTSLSDLFSNSTNNYGVSHSDDYNLLFESNYIHPNCTEDRAMQVKMIDYVYSVANNGFPDFNLDFEWKTINQSKKRTDFLRVVSPNDIRMSSDDNIGDKKFWSTIDFDENKFEHMMYINKLN